MKDYIEISFEKGTADNDVLLAALATIGYEGFEQDDDVLKAFISEEEFRNDELLGIARQFNLEFTIQNIRAQNWNAQWESGFEPVVVDDFVSVRAHFHDRIENIQHDIIITPKMSFGTGHHATTFLMLSSMRNIEFANKQILDFGTGTGILAILAEKLGAHKIDAVDIDEWSIENAAENLENNDCNRVSLHLADNPGNGMNYDVILANINRNVILDNLKKLRTMLKPDGTMILSGLLLEDEQTVLNAAKISGFKFSQKNARNNWLLLQFANNHQVLGDRN